MWTSAKVSWCDYYLIYFREWYKIIWRWRFANYARLWNFNGVNCDILVKGHLVRVCCVLKSSFFAIHVNTKSFFSCDKNSVFNESKNNLMTWRRNEMKSALPCVSRSFFFAVVLKFNKPVLKENENLSRREKKQKVLSTFKRSEIWLWRHRLVWVENNRHVKVVGGTCFKTFAWHSSSSAGFATAILKRFNNKILT